MFTNTFNTVVAGILSAIALILFLGLFLSPRVKRWIAGAKARKTERVREEQEEVEERRRKGAEKRENFKKQRFVVCIRERDGRKTSFESDLIGAIVKGGASVDYLPDNKVKALAEGDMTSLGDGLLAIIGTAYETDVWYCDYRIVERNGEKTRITVAGSGNSLDADLLAGSIVINIIDHLPIPKSKRDS